MGKIKITDFHFYDDPDTAELDLFFNSGEAQATSNIHVNDDTQEPYYVDLRIALDTHQIVGATILHAENLFDELARAFANRDLNHPDVRLFLEKKLEQYAECHAKELKSAEPEHELTPVPVSE